MSTPFLLEIKKGEPDPNKLSSLVVSPSTTHKNTVLFLRMDSKSAAARRRQRQSKQAREEAIAAYDKELKSIQTGRSYRKKIGDADGVAKGTAIL